MPKEQVRERLYHLAAPILDMQLKKLERLALTLIDVLADPEIDFALRQCLRDVYDKVERSICMIESNRPPSQPPSPRIGSPDS